MNELEEMISALQTENQQLVSENENLRKTTITLFEENEQLKQRLGMTSDVVEVKPEVDVVTRKLSDSVTEPAALDTPLQQEAGRTSIQLTAAYYLAWLTLLWSVIT
jgi:regulator of replication initiation timing